MAAEQAWSLKRPWRWGRAFALVELLALTAVLGALLVLLAVLSPRCRHTGWQAGSIANLHEFAAVTASYAADHGDQFWSYSWRYGEPTPSQYPELRQAPPDPLWAIEAQATDILRRRAGFNMVFGQLWLPTITFHHLPLADYLDTRLPMRFTVSPGDRNRLLWSNDPAGFNAGVYLPNQPDQSEPLNYRWPFSSSYRVPQAFFCPDAVSPASGTVIPAGDWGHYIVQTPMFNFGGRRLSKVNFPSQKVHVFDTAQWQGVRTPVFVAYPSARVPVLMVDGSARVRVTAQANQGFQPQNPRSVFPTILTYSPYPWEPPLLSGQPGSLTGYYCWTRGGIQGRDFEGQEFSTSNW